MECAGRDPWDAWSLCLVTMGLFGPFLTRWALRQATRLHGHHTEVAVALAIAMLLAFDAQWVGGMAAITGAYLAGLFVAMTPNRQKVCEELQSHAEFVLWTHILRFDRHGSGRMARGRTS